MVIIPKKVAPERVVVGVASTPTAEADENQPVYKLSVSAPGLAAADLSVTIDDGVVLAMRGATKRTGAVPDRTFRLPYDADAATAKCSHTDGIVTLTVAKKPAAKPVTIAVKSAPPPPAAVSAGSKEEE